ncbi:unnamed protein product, partial [Ranitomeya imitator]
MAKLPTRGRGIPTWRKHPPDGLRCTTHVDGIYTLMLHMTHPNGPFSYALGQKDTGNGHSRMLIFGTRDNHHLLAQSKEWFADGMFFTTPALFKQLYTIHVVHSGLVVPLVYTLLTDKSCSTYQWLLQELKNLQPGLQPDNLMLDFELSAIQASDSEFSNLSVCRKVQNEGLKMQYQGDHEFARWIRMIPALAFLPPQNVVQSFEELVEDPDFPQEAITIANYFEDSYIGRMNRRGPQAPLFPFQFWNSCVYEVYGAEPCVYEVYGVEPCVYEMYGEESYVYEVYGAEPCVYEVYGVEPCVYEVYGAEPCVYE